MLWTKLPIFVTEQYYTWTKDFQSGSLFTQQSLPIVVTEYYTLNKKLPEQIFVTDMMSGKANGGGVVEGPESDKSFNSLHWLNEQSLAKLIYTIVTKNIP